MTEEEIFQRKVTDYVSLDSKRSILDDLIGVTIKININDFIPHTVEEGEEFVRGFNEGFSHTDMYRQVAAEANHITYEEVTPVQRKEAKDAMFLLNYGFRSSMDNQILHPRSGASTDNEDSDDGVSRLERGE